MIKDPNIIHIQNDSELDIPIYRVFNSQRLLAMIIDSENSLIKPSRWDDPFENFILNVAALKNPNSYWNPDIRNEYYGQCWSLTEESDAMWRIYSPDKSGIKVKTTIRKLYDSLRVVSDNNGSAYVGKVRYLSGELLKEKIKNEDWMMAETYTAEAQATTLLYKRLEFEHEKEVRLLYDPHYQDMEARTDIYKYNVRVNELFEELVFDPRISNEIFEVYKFYLEKKLRYKNPITRSELYKLPDLEKL